MIYKDNHPIKRWTFLGEKGVEMGYLTRGLSSPDDTVNTYMALYFD